MYEMILMSTLVQYQIYSISRKVVNCLHCIMYLIDFLHISKEATFPDLETLPFY